MSHQQPETKEEELVDVKGELQHSFESGQNQQEPFNEAFHEERKEVRPPRGVQGGLSSPLLSGA